MRHRAARGSAGGRAPAFDAQDYKAGNNVERCINRRGRARAVTLGTDEHLSVRTDTIDVASIDLWLRDHTRGDPSNAP